MLKRLLKALDSKELQYVDYICLLKTRMHFLTLVSKYSVVSYPVSKRNKKKNVVTLVVCLSFSKPNRALNAVSPKTQDCLKES